MKDVKLEDFKAKHPFIDLIAKVDKPHKILKDERPIEVYYEDEIMSNDHKSRFWLFNDGTYVGNFLSFPCSIDKDDITKIGVELIDELLSKSDFADLDSELEGKACCSEFENVYKCCDECLRYRYRENHVEKDDSCLGAMYSIPTHMNCWDTEIKWNKIYGEGTENYKKYMADKMISHVNTFMWACGDSKELVKSIIEYAQEHPNNKCCELL